VRPICASLTQLERLGWVADDGVCPPSAARAVSPDSFTPAAIFTSIALFGLMRFPLIFLPFALIQLSNALVSMRRLSSYFMLEERREEVQQLEEPGGWNAA
jgi:hypothetical protein